MRATHRLVFDNGIHTSVTPGLSISELSSAVVKHKFTPPLANLHRAAGAPGVIKASL